MKFVLFPVLFQRHVQLKLDIWWRGILHLLLVICCSQAQAGVILQYHHVDESTPPATSISPAMFERHLQIIEEENYTVIPLDQLVSEASNPETQAGPAGTRPKIATITFDDAYSSIYTTAFPLLKARNWPFTIFVATDYVSDTNPFYLSWDQLKEMSEHGARIENHSLSHTHLNRMKEGESAEEWRARVRQEIEGAGKVLAEHGFASRHFAYPYGEYNLEVLAIVRELGLTGYGQQSGAMGPASNPQLLPRFPLGGVYVGEAAFRDKLRSLAMPVVGYQEPEPLVPRNEDAVEAGFKPALTLTLQESVSPRRMTCYGPGGLMTLDFPADNQVTATPLQVIGVGRSRYNCTLPAGAGRFYWFSQLFIRKRDDGSWYPEP